VLFVDAGQVQINQKPWTSTNNQAYISGAGLGLNWQGSSNWHARLYAARALAPAPSQLDGAEEIHSNAWIEIGKMF
jgi:hemolysin activation/secretion protein